MKRTVVYLIVCCSPLSRTPSHPHPFLDHTSHIHVTHQTYHCYRYQLHAKETRALTLERNVDLLVKMLKHESGHVRTMGLTRLLEVLKDPAYKQKLYVRSTC